MKIIISPSKTQNAKVNVPLKATRSQFESCVEDLVSRINGMSKKELHKMMRVSDGLLDKVYNDYKAFDRLNEKQAILTYSGTVFKEIRMESYERTQLKYLSEHLIILSALYGALRPTDLIKPYRLDMGMKPAGINLHHYWQKHMEGYFGKEELIINLASAEFSKMIKRPMVTIHFKEEKNGKLTSRSMHAKKARGMMLNYLVENQVMTVKGIKAFGLDGYGYVDHLSDDENLYFVRSKTTF